MADTCVSGAYGEIRGGSSPPFGIYGKTEIIFVGTKNPTGQSTVRVQADLRTDDTKLVRIANRFCWQVRSTENKILRAWSKSKTVPPSAFMVKRKLFLWGRRTPPDRVRSGFKRICGRTTRS